MSYSTTWSDLPMRRHDVPMPVTCGGCGPMGMLAVAGLGAAPSEDPRMVRKYATVKSTYSPRNVSSDQAARAATAIVTEARKQFPEHTVRKIGTTGWTRKGTVGYEVILSAPMRAGEIKQRNFRVGQAAGPRIGSGTSLYNALTFISPSDVVDTPAEAETPATGPVAPPVAESSEGGGFFSQKVGGIPAWMLLGTGAVLLVGVGVVAMRKKKTPSPVTANRRRRRRRRRSSRRFR